jgi:signal transduction histidine kinase
MTAGPAQTAQKIRQDSVRTENSIAGQLLHALNQPLTGLQCAMEVALAVPRTAEHYVRTLREGLELSGRMRALVGALREVMDGEATPAEKEESLELKPLLRQFVEELMPVAEANGVRIWFDDTNDNSCPARARKQRLKSATFRLLESALSLAKPGSEMRVEVGHLEGDVRLRLQWNGMVPEESLTGAGLGLLVAEAACRQAGAAWEHQRKDTLQTIVIRLRHG